MLSPLCFLMRHMAVVSVTGCAAVLSRVGVVGTQRTVSDSGELPSTPAESNGDSKRWWR